MTNQTSTAPAPAVVADATDPRDLLARAMATAVDVIATVRPDQMTLPTDCAPYDVRGLVAHMVGVLDRIVVIGNRGDVFAVPAEAEVLADDEWVGRWHATVHLVLDAWADDEVLDVDRQLPWTVLPGAEALEIYVNELTVHTWDLGRAVGVETDWDPEVLDAASRAIHAQLPDASRASMWAEVVASMPEGVPFEAPFADAVEVPSDAPAIERLVAWNGRRP